MIFWWILGASWGVPGGPMREFFGDLLALGAKMRPRRLQELQKTPQELPKSQIWEDFWWILDGFLKDFWLILGSFLVHVLLENG